MANITGRGATHNQASSRFNLAAREADGDWLDAVEAIDGPAQKLRTSVSLITPRTIISRNASPDIAFSQSINAYAGCEHGCIYCFARPTHAYHDLSPGLDFETRLFAKPDAARLLRDTLAKPGYRPAPIAMGTNTDPYQPIEARYRITRAVLELCLEVRHPLTITTKSDRVLRDLDLLEQLAARDLVMVGISVTSLDTAMSRKLEPRAASPEKHIAALGRLVAAGVPSHVSIAPIIPAITDADLEGILARSADVGVRAATWIMVRLPHEVAPLFRAWLDTHFPDRAGKVMATIQSIREGRDNDPRFFHRMKPTGVWADLIRRRFTVAARRHGIERPAARLDCTNFRPPARDGQLTLF